MGSPDTLAITLLAVTVIVGLASLGGALARRIGQPPVIGEILAGIALGPSLIGGLHLSGGPHLGGTVAEVLFPAPTRTQLSGLATLGLLVFMFGVGLELNLRRVRTQRRAALTISLSSVAVPMVLGAVLSLLLYPAHGNGTPRAAFILFMGVAMSVTAFPVLARILVDRGLSDSPLGSLALACAAVDDVLAWSLLAVASALANGEAGVVRTVVGTVAFLMVMVLVVRRLAAQVVRRFRRAGVLTPGLFVTVVAGMLISACVTEMIGIHAIFGAFAFGVAFPRDDLKDFVDALLVRLHDLSLHVLLPVFFVITGLKVDLRALDGASLVLIPLVVSVACIGKFVPTYVAARALGSSPRPAAALGALLNTRGLTELVALEVGVSIGVLDQTLLSVFVVMAVVTTVLTAPLLRILGPVNDDSPKQVLPASSRVRTDPGSQVATATTEHAAVAALAVPAAGGAS